MRIVGFGDSFILNLDKATTDHPDEPWYKSYQGMVGDHFDCYPEFRGRSGTGPWNMFFDFLNYPDKENIDVVIIAWSEINRLYHPVYQPINTHIAFDKEKFNRVSEEEQEVLIAANHYYSKLCDGNKKSYEMKALMNLFDDMTLEYKNTKFIHLPCFTWDKPTEWWGHMYKDKKPHELRYYHDFKHGMEIRPALMYMSVHDEWPTDLSKDRRECHMTVRVNRWVANAVIDSINNYQPGKIINIDVKEIIK